MRFDTYAKRVMAPLLVVLLMAAIPLHGGEGLDGLTGDGALARMVRENDPRGGIWVRVGDGATARLELELARRLPVVLHHLDPDPAAVFSLDKGEHRWSTDAGAAFYQHGLVWQGATRPGRSMSWVGFDPETGEQKRELSTRGRPPRSRSASKGGCQPFIATDAGIMVPRQGSFIDFETGEIHGHKFMRGGCRIGIVPANALVYSFPHACACFQENIRGFLAAHSDILPEPDDDMEGRRQIIGPAADRPATTGDSKPVAIDWPMHRYGVERSAVSPVKLGAPLSLAWSAGVAPQRDTSAARDWKLLA